MMIRMNENRTLSLHKRIMALIAALLVSASPLTGWAEDGSWVNSFDMDGWHGESVILEDPQYFMPGCDEDSIPVITSDGKSNVKVNGVQSKNKLVKYTIPQQLLSADPDFLALMVEAEKYIGYPYAVSYTHLPLSGKSSFGRWKDTAPTSSGAGWKNRRCLALHGGTGNGASAMSALNGKRKTR